MADEKQEEEFTLETQLMTIAESKSLDKEAAKALVDEFRKAVSLDEALVTRAMAIEVTDESQTELIEKADELRKEFKAQRIAVEAVRKTKKEHYLRGGQAIDAIAGHVQGLMEPVETHLKEQADFVKRIEEKREADRREKAEAALKAQEEAEEKEREEKENERVRASRVRRTMEAIEEAAEGKTGGEERPLDILIYELEHKLAVDIDDDFTKEEADAAREMIEVALLYYRRDRDRIAEEKRLKEETDLREREENEKALADEKAEREKERIENEEKERKAQEERDRVAVEEQAERDRVAAEEKAAHDKAEAKAEREKKRIRNAAELKAKNEAERRDREEAEREAKHRRELADAKTETERLAAMVKCPDCGSVFDGRGHHAEG